MLRYDKRNCVKQSGIPGCSYNLCVAGNTQNCLELDKISVTDFVTDAANAVRYLQASWPSINAEDISLIGHSQGCSVVPYAATQVPGVQRIVQLAGRGYANVDLFDSGIGIPIDQVMVGQVEGMVSSFSTGEQQLIFFQLTMKDWEFVRPLAAQSQS